MRAGLTMTVDIALPIGSLAETITVAGDSPMIETNRPTSVINIEGELLRAAPITSRRLFSDALDMAPGIGSRNVDDGVGRRAYYFRGSHIYAHAFQLEGRAGLRLHRLGGALDGHGRRHRAGRRNQAGRRGCVDAVEHRRGHERRHAARPERIQGIGGLHLPADGLEQRQHPGRRRAGWPADVAVSQPVGPLARGPHHSRQGLVLRHLSLCGSGERHQPDADRPAIPDGVQAGFRAVRQPLEEQAALRQSDDATRDTRAVRVLPERQEPLHELTRAIYRSHRNSIRRRLDGPREAELRVGSARDHVVLGVLQQQGRQRRRGLQRHDRIRSAGVGPPDRPHLERPTHRQRHPRGDEQR